MRAVLEQDLQELTGTEASKKPLFGLLVLVDLRFQLHSEFFPLPPLLTRCARDGIRCHWFLPDPSLSFWSVIWLLGETYLICVRLLVSSRTGVDGSIPPLWSYFRIVERPLLNGHKSWRFRVTDLAFCSPRIGPSSLLVVSVCSRPRFS